jgi:imidazolonepropionase-like amidohydrolase
MGPLEAIQAGTSYSAEVLGIADKVGTVKAGLAADIIAVSGDPVTDLRRLLDVQFVLQGGTVRVAGGRPARENRSVFAGVS